MEFKLEYKNNIYLFHVPDSRYINVGFDFDKDVPIITVKGKVYYATIAEEVK